MCFVVAAQVLFIRHWKNFRPAEYLCVWTPPLHGTTLAVRKFLAGEGQRRVCLAAW